MVVDIELEAARFRRRIRWAAFAGVAGTVGIVAIGVGLGIAIRYATTTRCPIPTAGITLPR